MLDKTRLAGAIYTKLTADSRAGFSDPLSPAQQGMVRAWCDAIAEAVVDEITTNAQVTVAGVTPGTGTVIAKVS